ncbi:hypothetical protein EW146_g10285 [Bondarzewia mesenterica]|uniref:Uncharacterized protein n=1 Tax=Bondarzewia mesenterica TaxID=1095465 RepID=A0A4S4KYQ2_9AGAM|nr:hypothetical protein EW146_g10285 [Bondarzewia mesenterica]
MKYVQNLWDEKALERRLDMLAAAEKEHGVVFRTPTAAHSSSCHGLRAWLSIFLEARNGVAADEVQAHIGMFGASTNDGYYELGLMTAGLIREAILKDKADAIRNIEQDPATLAEAVHTESKDAGGVGPVGDQGKQGHVLSAETDDLLL